MILLSLLACTGTELSQEWQLDRLRLIAIRAEPAEPRPGDLVTFSSLTYVPDDVDASAFWIGCVEARDCNLDTELLAQLAEIGSMTPEEQAALLAELQAGGFIGYEPLIAPTWQVPAEALEGLDEVEVLEGRSASIQVSLSTADDSEMVIDYLPVSEAPTRNTNPDIGTLEVDGVALESGSALEVGVGEVIELTARLEGGLESYTYRTSSGADETRTEIPTWRWYTSLGTLDFSTGGFGANAGSADAEDYSTATLTAPDGAGEGVLHAVVVDGRGGMGWWSVAVVVE